MFDLQWRLLEIKSVVQPKDLGGLNEDHVLRLVASFEQIGTEVLLQPIIVDEGLRIVDGEHRFEAARRSGWTHISAAVVAGKSDAAARIAGFEANTLRRSFTPVELEKMWVEYEQHLRDSLNVVVGAESPVASATKLAVTEKFGNKSSSSNLLTSSSGPRSRATLIKNITGLSEKTIDKVTEIRRLSQSETAPEELVTAAKNELIKLSNPASRTKVDTSHKMLQSLQRSINASKSSKAKMREDHLLQKLNFLLKRSVSLAEELNGKASAEIAEAASLRVSSRQDLLASRAALTIALAQILVIESQTNKQPLKYLSQVAPKVHRQIAEHIWLATKQNE